ncbi:MAG: hypothetical protein RJB05_581 [Armatimonadota bacterium]|jgi:hypothetical protein
MMFSTGLSVLLCMTASPDQDVLVKKSILTPTQLKTMAVDKTAISKAELVVILTKLVNYLESGNKQKRGSTKAAVPMKSLRDLVKAGYLPSDTKLAISSPSTVSRDEVSAALSSILIRHNEKVVPITPDSRRATPIPHPSENSGS